MHVLSTDFIKTYNERILPQIKDKLSTEYSRDIKKHSVSKNDCYIQQILTYDITRTRYEQLK